MVCVCSAAYCDAVEPVVLPSEGGFVKYESSKAGKRLQRSEGSFQHRAEPSGVGWDGYGLAVGWVGYGLVMGGLWVGYGLARG